MPNEGLQQWRAMAKAGGLVELLDEFGGPTRHRTELTWTKFRTDTADKTLPPAKRLDFFCINAAARDLIDTGNVRDALTTVPPWFCATAVDSRAGTDHSSIFLKTTTARAAKKEKRRTQANATILRTRVPGEPSYSERATPILNEAIKAIKTATANGDDAAAQQLQDRAMLDCVCVTACPTATRAPAAITTNARCAAQYSRCTTKLRNALGSDTRDDGSERWRRYSGFGSTATRSRNLY